MTVASLSVTVQHEFNNLFLGEKLGSGTTREVYAHALDPTKVIKIGMKSGDFANALEWEIWREVEDTELARWFAPCHHISHSGSVLIMERCLPCHKLPAQLPNLFWDIKRENFGVLDNQVVAVDYGLTPLLGRGLKNWRMKAVTQNQHER